MSEAKNIIQKHKVKKDQEYGTTKIVVQRGVHTVVIDARRMRRAAIGEFIQSFLEHHNVSTFVKDKLIAHAIGQFDLEPDLVFDEELAKKLNSLSDSTLMEIVRLRERRMGNDKSE